VNCYHKGKAPEKDGFSRQRDAALPPVEMIGPLGSAAWAHELQHS